MRLFSFVLLFSTTSVMNFVRSHFQKPTLSFCLLSVPLCLEKKSSSEEIDPKYYMKLLMIGTAASGKSTFAKQMKILHMNGFSDAEKEDFKRILVWNLFSVVTELLEHAQKLGHLQDPSNSITSSLVKVIIDSIFKYVVFNNMIRVVREIHTSRNTIDQRDRARAHTTLEGSEFVISHLSHSLSNFLSSHDTISRYLYSNHFITNTSH